MIISIHKSLWECARSLHACHQDTSANILKYILRRYTQRNKMLVRIFIKTMNHNTMFPHDKNICQYCLTSSEFAVNSTEGIKFCTRCSHVLESVGEEMSYSHISHGPPKSIYQPLTGKRTYSISIYKRCNHFKCWIKRIQGKERQQPTYDVVDNIKRHLSSHRITRITYDVIKQCLKSMKLQKYYNNIYYIMEVIIGSQVIRLSPRNEDMLMEMFMKIQESFEKQNNGSRSNMLSYSYMLKKFCELKNWSSLARQLPVFKSREKLFNADAIWKRICFDLDIPFIPSM